MVSLAIKYRPSSFDDLVGQLHAARSLKNSITYQKVAHAYLFFGSRGVGKTSTARILARSLNCLTKGPSPNPCNECENCISIPRGNCIDVIEMDAASNRGIEYIRELRENAKFSPMHSKYKIYIIDEVHMLTNESFNALLKTLEEPPPHVIFILATTEYHKIPETILSRCQSFAFKRFDNNEIKKRLKFILDQEKIAYSEEALLPIAERGEGSMRDAISLLDQVIAFVGNEPISLAHVEQILGLVTQEQFFGFLEAILKKDQRAVLLIIDQLSAENHNLKRFLWELLNFIKTILLIKENAFIESTINASLLQQAQQKNLIWQSSELIAVFEHLYRVYNNWSIFNSSKSSEIRVSLEMALVDLILKLARPSVSKIIDKLSRLSNAISEGKPFVDQSTKDESEKKILPDSVNTATEPMTPVVSAPKEPAVIEKKEVAPATDIKAALLQADPDKKQSSIVDTDILIQKSFMAEQVEIDPKVKLLFDE